MKLLITGGGGFLGTRLARALLKRGHLAGQSINAIVLTDIAPPPADLLADDRVQSRIGPLLEALPAVREENFDGVFHLASAVSGECEANFELGMRSNLDSTRALLDALRTSATVARVVFSSSVAVFGPDLDVPMPTKVADDTLPAPQTSYGIQKLMCEHLISDYTRKGFIDGRAARLMTVTVRPGQPNGAASSFFSSIIREPLAGLEAICPVDTSVSHPVSSPARTIDGLIAVFEASREAIGGRMGLNLPALNVTVSQMLAALDRVAGSAVLERVRFVRDERIAGIVANWPMGASSVRAARLGLYPEAEFADIIRQYIEDCAAMPNANQTLKGLSK